MGVHEFVPSGEFIGTRNGRRERCTCGLVQQGKGTIHDTSGYAERLLAALADSTPPGRSGTADHEAQS